MPSLFETLTQTLGSDALGQLGQQIGADHASTSSAVATALPMLIGALAHKSSQPDGAAALAGALQRDHDGSILDDVEGYLQGAGGGAAPATGAADGAGILGHLLGGQQSNVAAAVGQSSGLSADSSAKLLILLVPIVMGSLGRIANAQNLDASGLASLLGQEHQNLSQSGALLSGFMSLLDANHDGSVVDEIAGVASRFFSRSS